MTEDVIAQEANIVPRAAPSEIAQETERLFSLILDPSIPEARLDRIIAMHERLVEKQQRIEFVKAKVAMALQLPTISRTGRIVVYSKRDREYAMAHQGEMPQGARPIQTTSYAKQEDIIEAIRPILAEHGFDLSFYPGRTPEGRITMRGRLSHVNGHYEEVEPGSIEVDSSGSKTNPQGAASSQTYLRRQATISLLNIVSRDPRDGADNDGADGARQDTSELISEEQYQNIATVIQGSGIPPDEALNTICNAYKIEALGDLPAAKYDEAMGRIQMFVAKRKRPRRSVDDVGR